MFGIFGKTKRRMEALEAENTALKEENEKLKAENAELSKKTISQRTMEEEQPPSFAQVVDEWINGPVEGNNG